MDPITLKLECLKLANENKVDPEAEKIVGTAETYWRWIITSPDSSQPRLPGDTPSTS
jgi:hypothetical protein